MSWCRQRRGPASLARAAGRQNADRDAGPRPRPSGLRQLRVQRRDTRTPHSAAERLADRGDPGHAGAAGDRILLGRGRPDLFPSPKPPRHTAPVRRALAERSSCCPRWRLRGDGLAVSPQLAVLDSAVASRQRCRASRVAVRGSTAACRGMPPRSVPANRRIPPRSHGRPPRPRTPARRNPPGSHERPSGPRTKPPDPTRKPRTVTLPVRRPPESAGKSRTAIPPAHQATGTHPEATDGHPARPPSRRNAPGSHERPSGPHTKPPEPTRKPRTVTLPARRPPESAGTPRTAIRPAHRATGTHPEATNGHPARPPAAGTRREVMNGHHARLNCRRIPPPSHWRRAGGPVSRRRWPQSPSADVRPTVARGA